MTPNANRARRVRHLIYSDVISGRQRGALAKTARCALGTLSFFYGAAVRLRNLAFDRHLLKVHRAAVPVISIGNLTAGGTGKTPFVAAVAGRLASRGVQPVILSRGYRPIAGSANDEKLVLDQLCSGVPHLQSADRVASAREACRHYHAPVLILDDGFQHRRLARDLDIVLVDALNPWGLGRLLPRGLLREPRGSLRRADLVILTRTDQLSAAEIEVLSSEVAALRAGDPPLRAAFTPAGFINSAGAKRDVAALAGSVAAFCGIGNPEGFRRTLAAAGVATLPEAFRVYPDHHAYSAADLADLGAWARRAGAAAVVTTQKDLVKIPRDDLDGVPLWALLIELQIVAGRERFESALDEFAEKE